MLKHDDVQAAISARLDGEKYGLSDDVIDTHVASCSECAAYRDKAVALARSLNFVEPESSGMAPPQDLSEVILAGVEPAWRRVSSARQTAVAVGRVLLAVVGVIFTVWAIVMVGSTSGLTPTSADGSVLDPSADPERAALIMQGAAVRLGLASGLFFAAWRPTIVAGLLPVTCTMLAFMFGFTVRDIALGYPIAGQGYFLLAVLAATAALAFTWAADRGYMLRAAWHDATAAPR